MRVLEPLVTDARRARLREVIARRLQSVSVIFDRPYDPHNGAAVVRSCEAFGVQNLHVVERPGTPFAVARSVTRSAEKWIDVTCHAAPPSVIDWAHSNDMPLVATHPEGELTPDELGPDAERLRGPRKRARGDPRRARPRVQRAREGADARLRREPQRERDGRHLAPRRDAGPRGRPRSGGDRRRLYARGLFLSVPHADEVLVAMAEESP